MTASTTTELVVDTARLMTLGADNAQTAADNAQTTADVKVSKTEVTVTLSADGWVNNTQTVNAVGVTASSLVIPAPDPAADNYVAYTESVVRCVGQAEGTLTFQCDEVPSIALTVNVAVFNSGLSLWTGGSY